MAEAGSGYPSHAERKTVSAILTNTTMLAIENLAKSFDGQQILEPTTHEFQTGRTTAVVGPSGCGKTTLLRLLLGLVEPDGGSVDYDGTVLNAANAVQLRHRIGYVIQDGGLFPHLTARDNVTLLARYLGQSGVDIEARLAELGELMQISPEMLARFPKGLSGGQRQRIALMRALMLDPPVLLMDEPLGALDPMIRFDLQNDLKDIFSRLNKTVVLVTHDMHEAAHFAHEIILMRDGKVVQRGALELLLTSPADTFVTDFIRAQRADARLSS
jgi:osmoprotectant transport system ATP-binding protein